MMFLEIIFIHLFYIFLTIKGLKFQCFVLYMNSENNTKLFITEIKAKHLTSINKQTKYFCFIFLIPLIN